MTSLWKIKRKRHGSFQRNKRDIKIQQALPLDSLMDTKDELRDKLDLLDKNKKIYVMCQSGLRSYLAVRILMENGFNAYNFSGGYRLYNSIINDK